MIDGQNEPENITNDNGGVAEASHVSDGQERKA
jgi:hypothetical protein